jgi:hypothetical protein
MLRFIARDFLCGIRMTHTEHKLQLATLGMFVASKVLRQRFTVKVKP